MKAGLLNWWAGREPRERILLSILGGLATLFALIFLLVLPVQGARAEAQADLERAKRDLALVSRIIPTAGQQNAGARAPFDRSVLINIARTHGVKLTRIQPADEGAFSVWIDDAQTEGLYRVFEDLLSDYAVNLDRAVVSADANGRLSAQFTVGSGV